MYDITWLSHGGPGSHRYPPGSGDRPWQHVKNKAKKIKNKLKEADSQTVRIAAADTRTASQQMNKVSDGISKAWDNLHNSKYKGEDRSKDVRGLSNEELRRVIERIELDQKYNKLTMPPKSKGYDKTMAALAVLGSIATVTATGLSIAAGVKQLAGKTSKA